MVAKRIPDNDNDPIIKIMHGGGNVKVIISHVNAARGDQVELVLMEDDSMPLLSL